MSADCGLPYSDPVHTGDADVELEARQRAEFNEAVALRVEEKLYFAALVAYKLARAHGDTSVPAPRSAHLDQLELARIAAMKEARAVRHRANQLVQASRGIKGELIVDANAPSREAWAAGLGKSAENVEARDLGAVDVRDGPIA